MLSDLHFGCWLSVLGIDGKSILDQTQAVYHMEMKDANKDNPNRASDIAAPPTVPATQFELHFRLIDVTGLIAVRAVGLFCLLVPNYAVFDEWMVFARLSLDECDTVKSCFMKQLLMLLLRKDFCEL